MPMNQQRKRRIGAGQTGRWEFHGVFAFTGVEATKAVAVPMGRVEDVQITPIGAPAADENLSVNNTVSGTPGENNAAIVGTNGSTSLTVTRTGAAKTSGLRFSLRATGY